MKEENSVEDELIAKSRWEERPFPPTLPLIGPLISQLRRVWLRVAERGYIVPLWQQQNRFNHALLAALREQDERIVTQDCTAVEMRRAFDDVLRETRQLHDQLNRLNRRFPNHPS